MSIRTQLVGADLQGARLDGMQMRHTDLDGCNLAGASLVCTDLWNNEMMGANCTGADFTEAVLVECDLRNAKLTCTTADMALPPAERVGVSFFRADIRGELCLSRTYPQAAGTDNTRVRYL
jgi:uncharacterized protein YjbI with pentapeptide repeats